MSPTKRSALERLPTEVPLPATSRSIAWLLAAAAVLTLGVNQWAIRASPASSRTFDGMIVGKKWDIATERDLAGSIAVIGDSSGNFAVATDVLTQELGLPAWNLCTYGRFQATGAAWFLEEALRRSDDAPALVVVVLGSRSFALDPEGHVFAQIPLALHRLPFGRLGARRALSFVGARLFPLGFQAPAFSRAIRNGEWTRDFSILRVDEGGTSYLPRANPRAVPAFAERTLRELSEAGSPLPSARERSSIEDLIALAEEAGFDLVFVDSPLWEGLAAEPAHQAALGEIHAFLDEACRASGNATRLQGDVITFPAEDMENPFHLMPEPARRFTAELAARLEAAGFPR